MRWVDIHELTVASGSNARTVSFPSGRPYVMEIEGVVAALRGGSSNIARGSDGLRGVRIVAAAIRSLESGCTETVAASPRMSGDEKQGEFGDGNAG
jgi:predicted dehydrogenase